MPEARRGTGRSRDRDRDDVDEGDVPSIHAFWSGILTFGLVSVPVDLYSAYGSGRPSLRMVDAKGVPLARRYFCPAEEKELDSSDVVRGHEVEPDRFVVVRDEELEALEPKKSQEIDVQHFVDGAELDPIFFERSYVLTPGSSATRPYRLLARVMEEKRRVGIATFVMRGREYLVAIRAERGVLRAETLRFHDEIRSVEDVGLPEPGKADAAAEKSIRAAVDAAKADEIDPKELADPYAERLRRLVARKRKTGKDVVEPTGEEAAVEPSGVEVVDLLAVLEERLRGEGGAGKGRGRPRRAATAA